MSKDRRVVSHHPALPLPELAALVERHIGEAVQRRSSATRMEAIHDLAGLLRGVVARLAVAEGRAASRLEGEGRDGERMDWLEARGVSSIYFALGGQFNPGLMRLRPAIDAAMQSPAPASSPQPTTTTEEHGP